MAAELTKRDEVDATEIAEYDEQEDADQQMADAAKKDAPEQKKCVLLLLLF